jgi:hypothetical protein
VPRQLDPPQGPTLAGVIGRRPSAPAMASGSAPRWFYGVETGRSAMLNTKPVRIRFARARTEQTNPRCAALLHVLDVAMLLNNVTTYSVQNLYRLLLSAPVGQTAAPYLHHIMAH